MADIYADKPSDENELFSMVLLKVNAEYRVSASIV